MPERQQLAEARTTLLAEATGQPGRFRVQLINEGWGSSGHYSRTVLAEAAHRRIFPAGLHMYADHPTETEEVDRPERSIRDLWAVLATDATVADDGALVAEVQVFAPYRPLVEEMADAIGLSIRGGGQFEMGEAEGRQGRIITSIDEAASVDFVTHAGRGGRILELIESARAQVREARNIGNWIESRLHLALTTLGDEMFGDGRITRPERITLSGAVGDGLTAFTARVEADAPQLYQRDLYDSPPEQGAMSESTANDVRDALCTAVDDAYGGPEVYAWVRDYDPDAAVVYFDISGDAEPRGTFSQPYELAADGSAALTGERTEVSVRTTYVPVSPAGSIPTQESTEDSMAEIQIDEAEHRRLVADAGRVQTLESERDTATSERDEARSELADRDRRDAARPLVAEAMAGTTLPATSVARVTEAVLADVPATDAGAVDETALRERATTARTAAEAEVAEAFEAQGYGKPTGLGGSTTETTVTEASYDQRSAGIFGRPTVKGS